MTCEWAVRKITNTAISKVIILGQSLFLILSEKNNKNSDNWVFLNLFLPSSETNLHLSNLKCEYCNMVKQNCWTVLKTISEGGHTEILQKYFFTANSHLSLFAELSLNKLILNLFVGTVRALIIYMQNLFIEFKSYWCMTIAITKSYRKCLV